MYGWYRRPYFLFMGLMVLGAKNGFLRRSDYLERRTRVFLEDKTSQAFMIILGLWPAVSLKNSNKD